MLVSDAWNLIPPLPVKMQNGHYGRLIKIDLDREIATIETFIKNESQGLKDYSLSRIERYRPGSNALIEV